MLTILTFYRKDHQQKDQALKDYHDSLLHQAQFQNIWFFNQNGEIWTPINFSPWSVVWSGLLLLFGGRDSLRLWRVFDKYIFIHWVSNIDEVSLIERKHSFGNDKLIRLSFNGSTINAFMQFIYKWIYGNFMLIVGLNQVCTKSSP